MLNGPTDDDGTNEGTGPGGGKTNTGPAPQRKKFPAGLIFAAVAVGFILLAYFQSH